MKLAIAILFGVVVLAASHVSAGTITELYDTGVDNNDNVLLDGVSPDPHYAIVSGSDGSVASAVTVKRSASGYPVGPWWTGDSITSAWIMPSASYPGNYLPIGDYDYDTTFTLPSDANSVSISLDLATDDSGPAILLNGVQVSGPQYAPLFAYTPTSFTSDDVISGENTLTFVVNNSNVSPTGLRVDGINGTFTTTTAVPEPSASCLLLVATICLLACGRQFRKQNRRA